MEYSGRDLPNRLTKFRRVFHYTQTEVAQLIGVKPGKISQWEAGKIQPSLAHLLLLSRLYRTVPQELYPEQYAALSSWLTLREQEYGQQKK